MGIFSPRHVEDVAACSCTRVSARALVVAICYAPCATAWRAWERRALRWRLPARQQRAQVPINLHEDDTRAQRASVHSQSDATRRAHATRVRAVPRASV